MYMQGVTFFNMQCSHTRLNSKLPAKFHSKGNDVPKAESSNQIQILFMDKLVIMDKTKMTTFQVSMREPEILYIDFNSFRRRMKR